jgi:hypothetical protein
MAHPAPSSIDVFEPLGQHFWRGRSGRVYAHTVFTLIGCPAPAAASYLLVRRMDDGRRLLLEAGHTRSTIDTLNLADIRRRGAELEANEVHLHYGPGSADHEGISADIAAAVAEPLPAK